MDIERGARVQLVFPGDEERVCGIMVGLYPDGYLILSIPFTTTMKKKARKKQVVVGRYIHCGTVYGFRAMVMNYIVDPASLLFLEYPARVEVLELRREPRVPCLFPATLTREGELPRQAVISDISPSGCRVSLRDAAGQGYASGDRVTLQFYAIEEKNHYTVFTDVTNAVVRDGAQHLGLRFDPVHRGFLAAIAQFVGVLALEPKHAAMAARA